MNIRVSVENTQLLLRLRNGEKRLAFAVVNALNNTAKRIQNAMREKVVEDFTVRQKQFITRQVAKIDRSSFANVRRGQAWVEIAVGQAPRLLLSKFEEGGTRLPFVGKNVALPVIGGPARPSLSRRVPRAWTFEALQFHEAARTKTGQPIIVSSTQSAYIVPGVGVFQRVRGRTRLVYAFIPHLTLEERLGFIKTARAVTDRWFAEEIETESMKALAHDGGRSVA